MCSNHFIRVVFNHTLVSCLLRMSWLVLTQLETLFLRILSYSSKTKFATPHHSHLTIISAKHMGLIDK